MDRPIEAMWGIFPTGDKSVLELRGIWPKGVPGSKPALIRHFHAAQLGGREACCAAFEREAIRLNAAGFNVYIVMNPIRQDFEEVDGEGAKNKDIAYRDLLLIDIDRAQKAEEPATEQELEAARLLGREIEEFLKERGWPEGLWVMSGNGYHLYFVLTDCENSEENTELVRRVLHGLAKRFDNGSVKVDTTVYNASRITKVPGTIMRKGLETEDRPYRIAEVCD